jgi:cytoskeletal protein RodZ
LKREREFRGITLDQISRATRLSSVVIGHIEEDRYETLPKGTYVKGYLRSYARSVGLNVDEILSRYQKEVQGVKVEEYPFRRPRWKLILFLAALIALAVYLSSR